MDFKIPDSYEEAKNRYDTIIEEINRYNDAYFQGEVIFTDEEINQLMEERDFLRGIVDDMTQADDKLLSQIDEESGAYTKKGMIIKLFVIYGLSLLLLVFGYVFSIGSLLFVQFLDSILGGSETSQFLKNLYASSAVFQYLSIFFTYFLYPGFICLLTTLIARRVLNKSSYTQKYTKWINLGLWVINLIIVIIISIQFIPIIIENMRG